MNLLHHHSQKNCRARLVYFAEVPKFTEAEIAEVAGKKELEEPEKLDTRSLVEKANGVIGSHEQQLAVLPDTFNKLLHDEMVNYFLASPGRFEKDAEAGLDATEFEAYKEAMVGKVESTMEEYAPTEEEMTKIAESKEQAEKASVAAEQIEPLNVDEVEGGLGPIETVDDLGNEFLRYNGWNMSLQQESIDLLQQIGELQATVTKFHEARSGIRAYRKFLSAANDETFQKMCRLLARSEIQLKTVTEKYQTAQEKLRVYGELLSAESNRLKHELIARYKLNLEGLQSSNDKDGETLQILKEHFEKVSLGFDQLDENIDSAVLKNSLENQKLLEAMINQKQFLSSVGQSIRKPLSFGEAFKIVATVPFETWTAAVTPVLSPISSAAGAAGEAVREGVYFLTHLLEEYSQSIQNMPIVGWPAYGFLKANSAAIKFTMSAPMFLSGAVQGLSELVRDPLNAAAGLASLIGRKPGTDSFWEGDMGTFQETWENMIEDIFAVEDFKNGEYAFAAGTVIANIITSVTGYAAVKAAGKAGKMSYVSTRATGMSFGGAALEASIMGTRAGALAAYDVLKSDLLKKADTVRRSATKIEEVFQNLDKAISEASTQPMKSQLQSLRDSISIHFDELSEGTTNKNTSLSENLQTVPGKKLDALSANSDEIAQTVPRAAMDHDAVMKELMRSNPDFQVIQQYPQLSPFQQSVIAEKILSTEKLGWEHLKKNLIDKGVVDVRETRVQRTLSHHPAGAELLIKRALEKKPSLSDPDYALSLAEYLKKKLTLSDPVSARSVAEYLLKGNDTQTLRKLLDSKSFSKDMLPELEKRLAHFLEGQKDAIELAGIMNRMPLRELLNSNVSEAISSGLSENSNLVRILRRLKERDPAGFDLLHKHFDQLDQHYVTNILEGNRLEFLDTTGKKIVAYEGRPIGEGGLGSVQRVIYTVDGETTLRHAVIKKPLSDNRAYWIRERKGAFITQKWDDAHVNRPLHIGENSIIYETGPHVRNLTQEFKNVSPREGMQRMTELLRAMIRYRQEGYFHGDIKPANVLVWDMPDGSRRTVLIDNSPVSKNKPALEDGGGWTFTPGYDPTMFQRSQIAGNPLQQYSLVDAVSFSKFIAKRMEYPRESGPPRIGPGRFLEAYGNMLDDATLIKLKELENFLETVDFTVNPDAFDTVLQQMEDISRQLPDQRIAPVRSASSAPQTSEDLPTGAQVPKPRRQDSSTPDMDQLIDEALRDYE